MKVDTNSGKARQLNSATTFEWLSLALDLRVTLHTSQESQPNAIVIAQKKVSKGRLKTPPKLCSVATDPQV